MVLGQGVASIIAQWAILLTGDNNLAGFFLAIVVGQITQMLVMQFVFAISRYRESVADSDATSELGSGEPLATALEKISRAKCARESEVTVPHTFVPQLEQFRDVMIADATVFRLHRLLREFPVLHLDQSG